MKKMIAMVLCLVLALSSASCGAKKIPSLEDIASEYVETDLNKLAKTATQKDLIKKWGEPQKVNNLRLWALPLCGGNRFVVATLENGNIITIGTSYTLFATVVKITDNVVTGFVGRERYSKDAGTLTFLPPADCFGNEIQYEPGDMYYFQFDGRIMETYPQQINPPYSAMRMGSLSNEELAELTDLLSDK